MPRPQSKQQKKSTTASTPQSQTPQSQQGHPTASGTDAATLLRNDHRKVEALFQRYQSGSSAAQKSQLAQEICKELIVHTLVEEELFYPACREKSVTATELDEAQVEHDGAKVLINDLLQHRAGEAFYDAKVAVLSEYIEHHVQEEEKPSSGILAAAQSAGVDLQTLGQRIQQRKAELLAQFEQGRLPPPQPKAFMVNQQPEKGDMSRQMYERDRDERGRFQSEDDDRSHGRGQYSSRERDEDNGRHSSGAGRGWHGDSEGHSQAAERGWESHSARSDRNDDYGRGARGSESRGSREQEEDYRRSGGRNHGGWSGDPEGHSRASEAGWSERRGQGREEEDYRRGGGRSHGGYYGDSEGHSRAAESRGGQRGREDEEPRYSSRSDRDYGRGEGSQSGSGRGEGRGWYGDPEGHSRASERGWEHRGHSSGRDEEADERSGRSGGRGWYGDPQGHSEAARRRS